MATFGGWTKKGIQTIDIYERMYSYWLKNNKYISSSQLAREFNCSRVSMLKHLNKIVDLGRANRNNRLKRSKTSWEFIRKLDGAELQGLRDRIEVLEMQLNRANNEVEIKQQHIDLLNKKVLDREQRYKQLKVKYENLREELRDNKK